MSSRSPLKTLIKEYLIKFKGPILVGVFAIVLVDCAELCLPLILKMIVDSFENQTTAAIMPQVILGVSVIIMIQVVCRYVWRVSLIRSSMKTGADLRRALSSQFFQVSIGFYDRKKVGELMTLATSDIENMRLALGPGMIALVDSIFYCITIPIAMVWVAPQITLKFIFPIIFIPMAVLYLQRRISTYSGSVQQKIGELGTQTQEMVAGVRIARIYAIEKQIEDRLNQISRKLNSEQVGLARAQASLGPSLEFFLSTSLIILFSLGLSMSVGTLVALQRYLQKLMWPMSAVGFSVVFFQKAKTSGIEFYKILEEKLVESLKESSPDLDIKQKDNTLPLVEVKNLSFAYPSIHSPTVHSHSSSAQRNIINHLSFTLHEGEWLGIEGPVASGKSTLFSLLLKFYELNPNQISIQGKDIVNWDTAQLRKVFSPVLQDPFLFQGSIQYNLAVGSEISEKDSLHVAGVETALHSRMHEELGERGIGLSGGQKQRIAIARALRKPAMIYLLDDPLSSVDLKTAQTVLKSLSTSLRSKNKTVIFASHHPEHLKFCDRVIRIGGSS